MHALSSRALYLSTRVSIKDLYVVRHQIKGEFAEVLANVFRDAVPPIVDAKFELR